MAERLARGWGIRRIARAVKAPRSTLRRAVRRACGTLEALTARLGRWLDG